MGIDEGLFVQVQVEQAVLEVTFLRVVGTEVEVQVEAVVDLSSHQYIH